jgi:transcriptional regulator with XRE-family HTH domain
MNEEQPTTNVIDGQRDAEQERLASRLREAREYLGLSQEFVAEHLRVPRATISAMETAKRKVTSIELKQFARLYRRDYSFFLGDEPAGDEEPVGAALFRAAKGLSPADREQVLRFAQFLKQAGGGPRASWDRPRDVPDDGGNG